MVDAIGLMGAIVMLGMVSGIALLPAQGIDREQGHDVPGDARHYTCGSHWMAAYDNAAALERTRLNNPELYARMAERAKYGLDMRSVLSAADPVFPFYVIDRDNPGEYDEMEAVLRHIGDSILIWVDVRDSGRISASTIAALAHGLEREVPDSPHTRNPNKGVVTNDMEIFGRPPANREYPEYLVSFLLMDVADPPDLSGASILGYFNPLDQTGNPGSNRQNLLYIDIAEGLPDQSARSINGVISTMAHEFQHLINHARYGGGVGDAGTHWIYNEGLSEVASLRNGFFERSANSFVRRPNLYSFFSAPGDASTGADILRTYERAMLWTHYLAERYGDGFLYELIAQNGRDVEPLQKAFGRMGIGENAEDVYPEFWVANYLAGNPEGAGDAKYSYRFPLVSEGMGVASNGAVPSTETTEQELLRGHGAVAYRYANGDVGGTGVRVMFDQANRNYAVHAIITRSNDAVEVQRLAIGQEQTFERFTEIAFVIVNLYGDGSTVTWSIAPITTGVEEYAGDGEPLRIAGLGPNPLSGEGHLRFATAASGAITLELYDVRGRQVGTVVDERRFEAGEHTIMFETAGLEPGVYTARLRDAAGRVAVRRIVVVR